jgi:dihydroorotase-like cyclic amidohydrolase
VAARSLLAAQVYGLWPRKGHLGVGADADFVLVDMVAEKTLRNEDVVSKVGWTPFEGRVVKGVPVMTFVRGRLVAKDGKPVINAGWGEYVRGPAAM